MVPDCGGLINAESIRRAYRYWIACLILIMLAGCCEPSAQREASASRQETWVLWSYWPGGVIRMQGGGLFNKAPHYEVVEAFRHDDFPTYGTRKMCYDRLDAFVKNNKDTGWTFVCLPNSVRP